VDNQLRQEFKEHPGEAKAGSTVVGLLAAKQSDGNYRAKLINCGDSRGVIIKGPVEIDAEEGSPGLNRRHLPVILESVDHKPSHPKEKARIEAAGGCVKEKNKGDKVARIDGRLAVSRGLGDFRYKSDRKQPASAQKVTCTPDIYAISDLQPGAVVVLACDGLWDVMATKDVASFVSSRIQGNSPIELADIARELVSTSLKRNSHDNVTVLLAQLNSVGANHGA